MKTPNSFYDTVQKSQEFLANKNIDGWLIYDYRKMNPIFSDTLGNIPNITRPCWLWIPKSGNPELIVSYVDQNRFDHLNITTHLWVSRIEMLTLLQKTLHDSKNVAMEYSSMGLLPRISKVDAGTIEIIRQMGLEISSSADLVQYATQRWNNKQLQSHLNASNLLTETVKAAFEYIGTNINSKPSEFEVAEFIRHQFSKNGLHSPDGPVVAVNQHAADPHFEPTKENSLSIKKGDWVLIDLWGCFEKDSGMYADITWTAYVGDTVPSKHKSVFDAVIGGRDAAVDLMISAHKSGDQLQGWQLDKVARDYIISQGYGEYFSHRLGHSLGREVHGNAVNLDSWETYDTRHFLPKLAVTVEPGIYIPGEFGVRSEIDIFYYEDGPKITTEKQKTPYIINV